MKNTDLMIGDYVRYIGSGYGDVKNGDIIKVESVQGRYIGVGNNAMADDELFEPIPLTKDILNQNFDFHTIPSDGIHSKDEFWLLVEKPKRVWLHQYATSVFVQIDTKDEYGCECRLLQIKVLHVHQLQHALRLCGIEKEIVL